MSSHAQHAKENATMDTCLFIINNAPYGDERPYNALRLAMNLVKREDT